MPSLPVTVLEEMMRAVEAGEAARYAGLYADDAVITIHGGDTLNGRVAIEAHEVDLLRQFPGTRLAFHTIWQQGPLAVVHYAVNGPTPAGPPMGHEGLLFYRFHASGLIAEERRYNDSLTPMAQMGALGPAPARAVPELPASMTAHEATGAAQETDNLALAKACLAALDAKDGAAFLAGLAEAATLDEMVEPEPFAGRDGARRWFERWTSAIPDARTRITWTLGAGDAVLLEMEVSGTLRGPLGRQAATDTAFTVHRAAILEFRNLKITRITAFMNGKELAQATGQWPPGKRG